MASSGLHACCVQNAGAPDELGVFLHFVFFFFCTEFLECAFKRSSRPLLLLLLLLLFLQLQLSIKCISCKYVASEALLTLLLFLMGSHRPWLLWVLLFCYFILFLFQEKAFYLMSVTVEALQRRRRRSRRSREMRVCPSHRHKAPSEGHLKVF